MAQTFDIRFERSTGLAGIFEAPANSFRWKGAGSLSIDGQGISVAVRRGLLTLFARKRTRRIPANNLIEAYREGDSLRVEFSTLESPRVALPFWAGDRKAAAEIMRLLPTNRSVELEDANGLRRYRVDRRLAASVIAALLAIVVAATALQRYLSPPVVSTIAVPAPNNESLKAQAGESSLPAVVERRAASTDIPTHSIDPRKSLTGTERNDEAHSEVGDAASMGQAIYPPVTDARAGEANIPVPSAYFDWQQQAYHFWAANHLSNDSYLRVRDSGDLAVYLQLEKRWWDVSVEIYNSPGFDTHAFDTSLDLELAISRAWRGYLSNYVEASRTSNKELFEAAEAQLQFALDLTSRLNRR